MRSFQLKDAMRSILMQLNEGDRMNIMTFSGSTSFWKTEMMDIMDEDNMEEAKSHISSLKAGGCKYNYSLFIKTFRFNSALK